MAKRHWKNEYEYQRILQILDDYWLTENDEAIVVVEMHFKKADGQTQHKCIAWTNPNMRCKNPKISTVSARELLEKELPNPDDIFKDYE